MCKYEKDCNFDFQCKLATKNMNILADALKAEQTEPQTEVSYTKEISTTSKAYSKTVTEPNTEEMLKNARLVGYKEGVEQCNKEWLMRLGGVKPYENEPKGESDDDINSTYG